MKKIALTYLTILNLGQNRYLLSIQQFEDWARAHKKPKSGKQPDRAVNANHTHLCDSGAEVSDGTYLVYGLQLLRCDVSKALFLPISKQSLSGWRKQCPGKMRMPVPDKFVFDVATLALEEGQLEIALVMAIQLDGYLRPSECLSLTWELLKGLDIHTGLLYWHQQP